MSPTSAYVRKGQNTRQFLPKNYTTGDYNGNRRDTNYVFPILLHNVLTPIQIGYRKHKILSQYNRALKILAKKAKYWRCWPTASHKMPFIEITKKDKEWDCLTKSSKFGKASCKMAIFWHNTYYSRIHKPCNHLFGQNRIRSFTFRNHGPDCASKINSFLMPFFIEQLVYH